MLNVYITYGCVQISFYKFRRPTAFPLLHVCRMMVFWYVYKHCLLSINYNTLISITPIANLFKMSNSIEIIMDKHCSLIEPNPVSAVGQSNDIAFVLDEHMNIDSEANIHQAFPGLQEEFFHENQTNSQRGQVGNDFVNAVEMEWTSLHNRCGQHNDIQQLLTLSDFRPESVNLDAGTSASKAAKSKVSRTAEASLPTRTIPDASQIVKRQYRKYTEQQVSLHIIFVLFSNTS